MRCIFHKGSRKVDDVNSIPRPRVINREGGTEGRSTILRALRSRLKYYVSRATKARDRHGLCFDSYLGRLLSKLGEKMAIPVLSDFYSSSP